MYKLIYYRTERQKRFCNPETYQTADPEDFTKQVNMAKLMGWEIIQVKVPRN